MPVCCSSVYKKHDLLLCFPTETESELRNAMNGEESDSEFQDEMDDEANKIAADEAKKEGLVSAEVKPVMIYEFSIRLVSVVTRYIHCNVGLLASCHVLATDAVLIFMADVW